MRDPSPAGGYQPPGFGLGQFLLSLAVTGAILSGVALAGVARTVAPPKPQVLVVLDLMPPPPPPAAPPPASPEPRPDTPTPQVEAPIIPTPIVRVPFAMPIAATPPAPSPAPSLPAPSLPAPSLPAPSPPALAPAQPAPPATPAPAVADLGDLSTSMISARPPGYPLASRRAREQGTVVIAVHLGPDGRVDGASVARSSGYDRLDRAALEAVRRWRWSPTVRAGAVAEVVGLVRIPFVLRT